MIAEYPAHISAYLTFSPVGSGWRQFVAVREAHKRKVVSTTVLDAVIGDEMCTLLLYVPTLRAFWVSTRELAKCEQLKTLGVAKRIRAQRSERNKLGLRYSGAVVKEALELLRGGAKPTVEENTDDEREAIEVDLPADDENETSTKMETTAMETATSGNEKTVKPAKATKATKAKATKAKAKTAKPAKEKKAKVARVGRIDGTAKISVLTKDKANPYRKDTGLYDRFKMVAHGMTVDDLITKVTKAGGTRGNATGFLDNAVKGGHVKIG